MKSNLTFAILPCRSILPTVAALMLPATLMQAGTTSTPGKGPVVPPPAPANPFVTGTLSLTMDTHFVSYGQDIWGAGNSWNDPLFHPSLELNFDLGGGFTGIIGTWWDVNDNASTNIGSYIQEIDVWAGFAYTVDKWKFSLLYQQWYYASQTEQIVDFKVAYSDGLINPSFQVHGRVADGIPLDTGAVFILGVNPGTKVGPVSLSFPVQVSFDTDNFHGGDAGFGFVSAGVSASIPLSTHVGLGLGVTYYHTNDSVIVNPDSDFVTGTAGINISF